ncbi:alpha 1,2 mannosyltransferase [Pichia californica]|uniref:Mannosyltransferase n=1 Tax=Pichia californica TaxID=460514 RepID=A0A9P6WML6_9ASCO|nr:alpha 1,2 mannosyltransferase [[Candida] californica]
MAWKNVQFINISNLFINQNPTYSPLNNLLYNIDSENLSNHGIHARFTHILVNYPQIVGPLIFLIFPFSKNYIKTTTFLSTISGFIILSIFPHQELRFLLPSVPLLSTVISFSNPTFGFFKKYYKIALSLWLIYTSFSSLFYGLFHQAGVVPAIVKFDNIITIDGPTVLLFWRTYPPPTWMIDKSKFTNPFYISKQVDGTVPFKKIECDVNYVIDLMGSDEEKLNTITNTFKSSCNSSLYLITPTNAFLNLDHSLYTQIWSTFWHLDMDHFEYDLHGIQTFTPGIGLYHLL